MRSIFAWTYKHNPRYPKSAHRCRCCWKVIEPGTPVLVWKHNNKTWMLHDTCKASRHSESYTWGEVFHVWEADRQAKLNPRTINPYIPEKATA
jgi:hypothetical protein